MNDPVSEFLAREQNALADLGEDFVAPEVQSNENGFSNSLALANGNLENLSDSQPNQNDMFGLNGFDTPIMNGSNGGSVRVSPTFSHMRSQSQQLEEEPEKILKWREHQKELIAEKDKAEEKKKDELRHLAKKELEQFYVQRKAQLEQRKKTNREREAVLNEEVATKDQQEVIWERVARMIEGGGGSGGAGKSKAGLGAPVGKDTSRMKHLITMYARGDHNDKSPSPETEKRQLDV